MLPSLQLASYKPTITETTQYQSRIRKSSSFEYLFENHHSILEDTG